MATEEISFQKVGELFLDAHPILNWETRYVGSNQSELKLRSVGQMPNSFFVNLEPIS